MADFQKIQSFTVEAACGHPVTYTTIATRADTLAAKKKEAESSGCGLCWYESDRRGLEMTPFRMADSDEIYFVQRRHMSRVFNAEDYD